MSYEFDQPPEVSKWGLEWIAWLGEWWRRAKGPIDLTGADKDYKLAVGEVARIDISAATTVLRIAVEDGVYEVSGLFDSGSFGADQDIQLQANNADYVGEFLRMSMLGDIAIATDEYDTVEVDEAVYTIAATTRLRNFRSTLTINGLFSSMVTIAYGITSGSRRTRVTNTWRHGSVEHTLLGTFLIGEAADGVLYIRRTA